MADVQGFRTVNRLCHQFHTASKHLSSRAPWQNMRIMAATVSGSKTVTQNVATHLTATTLTNLLATPIENLTVAQLESLIDAIRRVSSGGAPTITIGTLLK